MGETETTQKYLCRSYKLPAETIEQLERLDELIPGKTKRDIIAEAVAALAEEHGVAKRVENSLSMGRLEEQLRLQEELLKVLATTYLEDLEDPVVTEKDLRTTKQLLKQLINAGTPRTPEALWEKAEPKLPESLSSYGYFRLYCYAHGIPSKKAKKLK